MSGFGRFPGCICCSPSSLTGKVLIWLDNTETTDPYTNLASVYSAMGLTVHDDSTWSGTLSDYALIHWPVAVSDPTWWSQISGGTWSGRIHITAENNVFSPNSVSYVNSISGITGISVTGDTLDILCSHDGPSESDDLTSGTSTIKYAYTSKVSGGTTLSKTVTGSNPWLSRNKSGNIDFVISGDANHIADDCAGVVTHNTPLIQNMWNVPV